MKKECIKNGSSPEFLRVKGLLTVKFGIMPLLFFLSVAGKKGEEKAIKIQTPRKCILRESETMQRLCYKL